MDVDIRGAGSLQSVDGRAGTGYGDTTLGDSEESGTETRSDFGGHES